MPPESDVTLTPDLISDCERVLGYVFTDRGLLARCLTHASAARTRLESNERLEFLGDAILGAIVCELLYHQYPESSEGELTRIKSVVVSRETCARMIEDLGLMPFLVLGKGIATHDQVPMSVLATAFEAILGAIYIDGGFESARQFVLHALGDDVERAADCDIGVNYKSQLQQRTQRAFGETPSYVLLDEKGPDHSKCFKVAAIVGERQFPAAWGASKKVAEQRAAHNALATMDGETPPHLAEETV
ncbi:MAG: ribonuclease III [Planctomycetaceae bacterium]|nr:ribonuclease III [Planctomycetaceae bacterium]